ncbi:galactose-1-phosphate uridylyltransferase [Curtobacterium sp. MCBD17_034]|uniref:galactose-1-phosphate uridylyltransferase n=1 Tax=unclassified Curtobacterium TaxID=257496 RepID=UPI000DA93A6B|nr:MULTISPECIES: galactose-1-phosphate uridylyltransferase [unclassified Curtobacterium]PZF60273.1 galactose-1-phosphate uridylyltransferase [Curtobacterium sp. MCBD17_034]PZM34958.1 galactose-1-phosphate uridylyltransferase [Curtobacterium sp. MCBD17_031]
MSGITKRATSLADGRDLIYFDDADTQLPAERRIDERVLDSRPATAHMRQDVLTGEWVSIASARQNRAFLPPANLDPLAPQTDENPSEIPSRYDVAVFENKSPSFGPDLEADDAPPSVAALSEVGLNRTYRSVGRCEVVCFSPETSGSFASITESRARTVVEAWADRTAALSAMPGIEQVFPFENRGEAIGVTLHHPHGQIYAYPYVTPRTQRLLASIERFGPDLFEQHLANERASDRVVLAGEHFTAFVPFAARWPLEIHMLPHRHVPDFAGLTDAEKDELAHMHLRLTRALDALYDSPTPYIAAWHQAPVSIGRDAVRLMLQITSPRRAETKLKYLAGSEAAMGAWIGDVVPEAQAEFIRGGIERV